MKEEFEFTVGTNGNKKEENGTKKEVRWCYNCDKHAVCNVNEQVEKLATCWAKVLTDLKQCS